MAHPVLPNGALIEKIELRACDSSPTDLVSLAIVPCDTNNQRREGLLQVPGFAFPATATLSDVPVGSIYFKVVEALYASGSTAGCGGGKFCPDTPLTCGQMAVVLASALGLHLPG